MRATIDGVEIEGTPAEVAAFLAAIRADFKQSPKKVEVDTTAESDNQTEITENFAYRALRRLPLSVAQKLLLRTLKAAHPKWTLSSQLQTALNCSPTSLGGVFGGLGRRVSATKGYASSFNLWDWMWDDDEGEWAYKLPDAVMIALDRAGV